jgi:hypothetical protein
LVEITEKITKNPLQISKHIFFSRFSDNFFFVTIIFWRKFSAFLRFHEDFFVKLKKQDFFISDPQKRGIDKKYFQYSPGSF